MVIYDDTYNTYNEMILLCWYSIDLRLFTKLVPAGDCFGAERWLSLTNLIHCTDPEFIGIPLSETIICKFPSHQVFFCESDELVLSN